MDAHNFYVLTLAEMGPQGEIVLLVLLFMLMRLAKFLRQNAPRDDPEMSALSLGFTVMTVCMMLGKIYGSPFFEGAMMAPYWAMCGLLERYVQFKMQAGAAESPGQGRADATLVERFPLAVHLGGR